MEKNCAMNDVDLSNRLSLYISVLDHISQKTGEMPHRGGCYPFDRLRAAKIRPQTYGGP
jgi:hypothetical protein